MASTQRPLNVYERKRQKHQKGQDNVYQIGCIRLVIEIDVMPSHSGGRRKEGERERES